MANEIKGVDGNIIQVILQANKNAVIVGLNNMSKVVIQGNIRQQPIQAPKRQF